MKIKITGTLITLFSILVLVGTVCLPVGKASASTTETIQPASTITYNEELVVNDTARFDSAYIGKQGVGGVTFFNGTIINNTTDVDSGVEIPVTFGDDVRIDGEIFRTEVGGDDPIKLADTIRPQTTATYDLGTSANRFRHLYLEGDIKINGGIDMINEDITITNGGLSITNGNLIGEGIVSSENIMNRTVTGSDISYAADLDVNSLTTTGDITQNVNADGAVKASFVYVPGEANVTKRFGITISNIWPVTTGVAEFTIDISLYNRYFQITPLVNTDDAYPYFCTGGMKSEYVLEVRCYEPDGSGSGWSYAPSGYIVAIY